MRARTSTLLILAYGVITVVVVSLVVFAGSQYRKTEQLIAKLNQVGEQTARARSSSETKSQPRGSMRPSLLRLQRLLEDRTQVIREQQNQLKQQTKGQEKLQQENAKLADAYEELLSEHDLLLGEVEFYLIASNILADQESVNGMEAEAADDSSLPSLGSDPTAGVGTNESTDSALLELANLEVTRLREELTELNTRLQRDSLIATYASQVLIEMGPAAIPLLSDVLVDKNPDTQVWAAWVLGQMGPNAVLAKPGLEKLLDHGNARVAAAAADALRKIDGS